MGDDCPCTPVAAFVEKTHGQFNLVDEKFKHYSEQIQTSALMINGAAVQVKEILVVVAEIQKTLEYGSKKFETQSADIEELDKCLRKIPDHVRDAFKDHAKEIHVPLKTWLKRLTIAGVILFVAAGERAWAFIGTLF